MRATPPGLVTDALAAADKLAQSRERLRLALSASAGTTHSAANGASSQPWPGWLGRLINLPAARLVLEALRLWWGRHPLRVVGTVAFDATKTLVQPLARQHPLALVLAAAVVGATLRWTRPWRWLLRPGAVTAVLAGLLPQLLRHSLQTSQGQRAQGPARGSAPLRPGAASPL